MVKPGTKFVEFPKNKRVTVRLTEDLYNRLAEYSTTHSQAISETVSESLELLLKKK